MVMSRAITRVLSGVVAVGAAVTLAACSSSGGGSGTSSSAPSSSSTGSTASTASTDGAPSLSDLENKIKAEPEIQTVLKAASSAPGDVGDKVVACVAAALQKDGDPADLQAYVEGKKSIQDVGTKAGTSESGASQDVTQCAEQAVSGASSAAAGSSSSS